MAQPCSHLTFALTPLSKRMQHHHQRFTRSQAVLRAQRWLEERTYPRLQMTLIAAQTGAFDLLTSFLLLRQGIESMTLRYPLALACAYAMFLFLIWLWLRTNAEDYFVLPELPGPSSSAGSCRAGVPMQSGGGSDFGGGGASASFDGAGDFASEASSSALDIADPISAVADADDLAIPVLAVVLAIGLALASLYVIYIAPALLAEVMVDGALSCALYRYVRGDDPAHWLATAIRRTVLPFLATCVFLIAVGAVLSVYAPGAHSIGEVVRGTSTAR